MHNGRECSPNRFHIPTNPLPNPVNQQRIPYSNQTSNVYSYTPQNDQSEERYEEFIYTSSTNSMNPVPFKMVFKQRTTANKKERRRTQSINSAFAILRDCIPNVPFDTKLSKVKKDQIFPFRTFQRIRNFNRINK